MTTQPNPAPSNPDNGQNPQPETEIASDGKVLVEVPQREVLPDNRLVSAVRTVNFDANEVSRSWIVIIAIAIMAIGLLLNNLWIGLSGSIVAILISLRLILPATREWVARFLTPNERQTLFGLITLGIAIAGLFKFIGVYRRVNEWLTQIKWDEFGSWADWFGALGQIMIAVLAVYVAWEQYVISKDLTIRQNTITQQQTIDTYFQGISDLALSDEGLLEDWPQERAFAEGRTAAILSSVDAGGKAKILRFLSQSKLLTPLKRDGQLGRPILDGSGGYEEDRNYGLRVIDLGVMLAGANLEGTDLRWADLSNANMVRANLNRCDLVKANLARTVLYEATLNGADMKSTRLFYGNPETASPRSRLHPPNYQTGAYTGAVVENADFTNVHRLDQKQRDYLCAWGGERTRSTIPGGCKGIESQLRR
ncbi:pentapeptide repeat-containing protein [Lusitaniella coriacea]|uniref:pentapeptide repeat-containing protein n=1 Tax=Lusitaniella coriacea TaxID=1983105 RepID=UPI003CFB311C